MCEHRPCLFWRFKQWRHLQVSSLPGDGAPVHRDDSKRDRVAFWADPPHFNAVAASGLFCDQAVNVSKCDVHGLYGQKFRQSNLAVFQIAPTVRIGLIVSQSFRRGIAAALFRATGRYAMEWRMSGDREWRKDCSRARALSNHRASRRNLRKVDLL